MSVGKVIAITGASSGIGEAIAELVATRGARVLIGARRTDRLEALSDKLTAAGGQADYRELDVTRRQSVTDFVRAAVDRFGRLDVIVNNAGVMPLSPLAELKVDEWDRMIDTNVKGVLYGIAAALPIFRAQGNGHVVNISSIGALGVVPTAAVYCAQSGGALHQRGITAGKLEHPRYVRQSRRCRKRVGFDHYPR